jgi:hypothetical protein
MVYVFGGVELDEDISAELELCSNDDELLKAELDEDISTELELYSNDDELLETPLSQT